MAAAISKRSWRRPGVWALVLLLLGAIAGGIAGQIAPRSYEATTQLFASSSSVQTLQQASDFRQQVTASYADIATTPLVLGHVITRLGLHTTAARLAEHVSARVATDTVLIGITASDPSPARAARIANAVGAELVAVVPSLTPTGGSSAEMHLSIVRTARAATATADDHILLIGLGAAAGLVAALVVLLIRSGRPKPPTGRRRPVWQPRSPVEPA